MADKTVQMTAPNGAKVTVSADRVELMTRNGFAEVKAPAKKSTSSKSKK